MVLCKLDKQGLFIQVRRRNLTDSWLCPCCGLRKIQLHDVLANNGHLVAQQGKVNICADVTNQESLNTSGKRATLTVWSHQLNCSQWCVIVLEISN